MPTNVTINVLNTGSGFGFGAMPLATAVTAYAAHVARLQAIDPTGSYYNAQDYTGSASQAGKFTDAFGGILTYTAPNVMASPTRIIDGTSGKIYVSADGADDAALGSASETVNTITGVFRSPSGQTTWSNYGGVIVNMAGGTRTSGIFGAGSTSFYSYNNDTRRNGIDLGAGGSVNLSPITNWMVVTIQYQNPVSQTMELFSLENTYFPRLHLACLRIWPVTPASAVVTSTEQEMMNFYSTLIATNPS